MAIISLSNFLHANLIQFIQEWEARFSELVFVFFGSFIKNLAHNFLLLKESFTIVSGYWTFFLDFFWAKNAVWLVMGWLMVKFFLLLHLRNTKMDTKLENRWSQFSTFSHQHVVCLLDLHKLFRETAIKPKNEMVKGRLRVIKFVAVASIASWDKVKVIAKFYDEKINIC